MKVSLISLILFFSQASLADIFQCDVFRMNNGSGEKLGNIRVDSEQKKFETVVINSRGDFAACGTYKGEKLHLICAYIKAHSKFKFVESEDIPGHFAVAAKFSGKESPSFATAVTLADTGYLTLEMPVDTSNKGSGQYFTQCVK